MNFAAVNPLTLAADGVRKRFRTWWQSRLRHSDTLLLTQRNIYILPTRAGLMFAATLLILLIASINYQLNLGYVLTFLLAGSGVVSMQLTHNTLRGLTLRMKPVAPVFAGDAAVLEVVLSSPNSARHGIGLKIESAASATLTWVDVPAGGHAPAHVSFVPSVRGRHEVPTLSVETRFPLGLFRAWAIWRPVGDVLVYPKPERPAAVLPTARAVPGGSTRAHATQGGEIEGIRAYRRGDPLKLVFWKKAAKAMETGGELVSRDTSAATQRELWLDWQGCGALAPEDRLSRLAAWVLAAERAGVSYGLRLPGAELARGHGEGQRRACLEALALWH
ncbi:DUF58 domain-containing protein [Piscinibacter sp.]|uniref:DUF58 domain-containing protein n=1 Tax=Piscinibacter sp. TaxID=1903157 RepID=UPI002C3760CD|nr:DUF58 domain-containing protein [Albitalea sp.]HUG23910.1 DUF58 domain-containing protein [Albitalea sp.]